MAATGSLVHETEAVDRLYLAHTADCLRDSGPSASTQHIRGAGGYGRDTRTTSRGALRPFRRLGPR